MKRILILMNTLTIGGAEKQTVLLANGLSEHGHELRILYLDERNALEETISRRIATESLRKKAFLDMDALARIRRIVQSFAPDIVLCENSYSTLYGVLACRRLRSRLKLVSVQHTTILFSATDKLKQPVYRVTNRLADALVFVCETQRTYWQDTYGWKTGKSEVIYNGVDVQHFFPSTHMPDAMFPGRDFVIGINANFRPEKEA